MAPTDPFPLPFMSMKTPLSEAQRLDRAFERAAIRGDWARCSRIRPLLLAADRRLAEARDPDGGKQATREAVLAATEANSGGNMTAEYPQI